MEGDRLEWMRWAACSVVDKVVLSLLGVILGEMSSSC